MLITIQFFLILTYSYSYADTNINFLDHGKKIKKLEINKMLSTGTLETLEVWEPHENKNVKYEGLDTLKLLDTVFGKKWKSAELVVFICADGYTAAVPKVRIEETKTLLAVKRAGSKTFHVDKASTNEGKVELGPMYLVWNNINNPLAKSEGDAYWPYQIVGIELSSIKAKYANLLPPEGSDIHVRYGFKEFQKHCLGCHKVQGVGGERGPDLAFVDSKGANYVQWLRKWISDPQKIKPKTIMPPLNKNLENYDQALDDIINYLLVMRKNK